MVRLRPNAASALPGSSMVERSAVNRNVRGSSPLRGANLSNLVLSLGENQPDALTIAALRSDTIRLEIFLSRRS